MVCVHLKENFPGRLEHEFYRESAGVAGGR